MTKAEIEKMRDDGSRALDRCNTKFCANSMYYEQGFNAAVEILWPRLVGLSKSIDSYRPGYDWCPKLAEALKEHGVDDE